MRTHFVFFLPWGKSKKNGLWLSVSIDRRTRIRSTTTARTAPRSCISRSRFLRRYAEPVARSNPAFSARSSRTARVSAGNCARAISLITRGGVRASSRGPNDANTRRYRDPSSVSAGFIVRIARSGDARDSSRARGSFRRSRRTRARVPEPDPAPRARITISAREYLRVRFAGGGRKRGDGAVRRFPRPRGVSVERVHAQMPSRASRSGHRRARARTPRGARVGSPGGSRPRHVELTAFPPELFWQTRPRRPRRSTS